MLVKRETCLEYYRRRLSEGWKCISLEGYNAVLLSPEGIRRELDLRNDVETLRPNAGGDETALQWFDGSAHEPDPNNNYLMVDEVEADDSVTYVRRLGVDYTRDLYNLPAHSVGSGTINFIKVYFRIKISSDKTSVWAKPVIKSNSTVTEGTEVNDNSTDWVSFSQQWNTNPADSEAWEWADIDALQIGVALVTTGTYIAQCTQVYVEVDYTPAVPVVVTPGTLALNITTYAPTITISGNRIATPPKLALTLTTYTPIITISGNRIATPPKLALTLTTYTPIITISGNRIATPSKLALALTAYAPSASIGILVTPFTLALALIAYVPTVIASLLVAALGYILELHDSDGDLVSILHNAYGISLSEAINEAPLLDFSIPADDSKATDLTRANEVWLRNYKTGVVVKKFRLNLRRDTR